MRRIVIILCILFSLYLNSFSQKNAPLFTELSSRQSGIDFNNKINEDEGMNVLAYEYFYNGGGVAAGDINNDGLIDLFFTANLNGNKLYLNKGKMTFDDITRKAKVGGRKDWKTGVTMVDLNADGWLDIYVCYSGRGNNQSRRNELFINNRDLSFTERAKEYGLDDPGCSTQAIFFDYDIDGDLDCYVLNHNIRAFKNVELKYLKSEYDSLSADRLYRNDKGRFTDVSRQAGISGNPISFGLGVAVSDINNDGWPDIYVSNDYTEQDYCLINNMNGTFSHRELYMFTHLSQFSMGSDIADINNDGLVDIYTLDMLPEDNRRQKLLQAQENYELYQEMSANGFHYQFMRNMLHLSNGNGTFSEIGQLAGVSNTDWSWAPLFTDLDNDGYKDLVVTNGYMRDYTNKDFLKFWGDYLVKQVSNRDSIRYMDIISRMPSTIVSKYIFRNNGDLTFKNVTESWGFKKEALTNGAAYADLDNDGDMDLVINNINQSASILRNDLNGRASYAGFVLSGSGGNTKGLGAKLFCYTQKLVQFLEQMPTRGYQSSVSEVLHFGLGDATRIDSFKIIWPDGSVQRLFDLQVNRVMNIKQEDARPVPLQSVRYEKLFGFQKPVISFSHLQLEYNDFKRQPLMPSMLSQTGPAISVFDANGDGKADVFVGSSEGQSGNLYIQGNDKKFSLAIQDAFASDTLSTTSDIITFDAEGDGDLDIYVVRGGYNYYSKDDPRLNDALLLNNGKGIFTISPDALPVMTVSKSTVAVADIDKDGDIDLFVGGRCIPGEYPEIPKSFLLLNDGSGKFSDKTSEWALSLIKPGMITDAHWEDIDKNGYPDLLLVGEWMAPTVYVNDGKKLLISDKGLSRYSGLWNTIELADLDDDGDKDIIAGNWGLNSQLQCSEKEPLSMIYADFDGNGSIDPFLCCYIQGRSYPYVSRDELLDQIYPLRKKFTSYYLFANATMEDIFSPDELKRSKKLEATHLRTMYFENIDGVFTERELPVQAQFSQVKKIIVKDMNDDGKKDILLLGNNENVRLKIGKMSSNFGTVLLNNGKGKFTYATPNETGLMIAGDVKDADWVLIGNEELLLIAINNGELINYKLNK